MLPLLFVVLKWWHFSVIGFLYQFCFAMMCWCAWSNSFVECWRKISRHYCYYYYSAWYTMSRLKTSLNKLFFWNQYHLCWTYLDTSRVGRLHLDTAYMSVIISFHRKHAKPIFQIWFGLLVVFVCPACSMYKHTVKESIYNTRYMTIKAKNKTSLFPVAHTHCNFVAIFVRRYFVLNRY